MPSLTSKALIADFTAALIRVRDTGKTVSLHGTTISRPKPTSPAVHVESRRTVRDPWTGTLSYASGTSGGSLDFIKRTATVLAHEVEMDRALRARLLAEGVPGILDGFTCGPEAA